MAAGKTFSKGIIVNYRTVAPSSKLCGSVRDKSHWILMIKIDTKIDKNLIQIQL